MSLDWTEALRRECDEMTRFCRELSDVEWRTPSAAEGWRIQDVVAHVGGGMHSMFTLASLKLVISEDIERTNDEFVEARYTWSPAEVFAEYQRWQGRVVRMTGVVTRTPLAKVAVPLAELGRFPLDLVLGGALAARSRPTPIPAPRPRSPRRRSASRPGPRAVPRGASTTSRSPATGSTAPVASTR